jgi:hypothetical protein
MKVEKKHRRQKKEIKFPENRKISEKLLQGDRVIIAKYSNLSVYTIRDIMQGHRRLTDDVARAIIRLMNERKELDQALNEIVNQ